MLEYGTVENASQSHRTAQGNSKIYSGDKLVLHFQESQSYRTAQGNSKPTLRSNICV